MIIMKKAFKIIIPIAVVLIIAIVIVVVSLSRKEKHYYMNFEKHYSIIYNEEPEMDVSIYTTNNESILFNKDNIVSSYLYNVDDTYNIKIEEVIQCDNILNYNDKEYKECIIHFSLDVKSEDMINIDNCYLLITFNTNEKLNIKLGNITFSKIYSDHLIQVKKVQSIVNSFGEYSSLAGIILQIDCDQKITINNIRPISNTISINTSYLKVVDDITNIDNSTDAKEVFGYGFDSFQKSYDIFPFFTTSIGESYILIPITYLNKEFVDSLGLIIEYSVDDNNYQQLINPYKLFNTTDNYYFIYEYELVKN